MKPLHTTDTVIPVFLRRKEQERPESMNFIHRSKNKGRRLS